MLALFALLPSFPLLALSPSGSSTGAEAAGAGAGPAVEGGGSSTGSGGGGGGVDELYMPWSARTRLAVWYWTTMSPSWAKASMMPSPKMSW